MVNCIKLFIITLLFCTSSFGNTDDESPQINAFLNSNDTAINVPVTLTVELFDKDTFDKDTKQKISVKLPDLSSSFKIISELKYKTLKNHSDKVEIKYIYKYLLLPLKQGNLSIPSIQIKTKNGTVLTDPLYLTVGEAADSPAQQTRSLQHSIVEPSTNTDILLEAHISTQNIYLGQSIQYKLVLYRKRNYWNTMNVSFPNFEKAWVENLEIPKKEHIITKDNQRYYAYEITKKKYYAT